MKRLPSPRRPQPAPIRLAHWLNLVALAIMMGSGLRIFVAFPELGPRGGPYAWYPFQGRVPPQWAWLGDGLGPARHWHFAFAWVLVLNGGGYLLYLFASGEWQRRLFVPRRDGRNALQTLAWYLRVRRTPPEQGLYNGLQRATYTGVLAMAVLSVLSGLVIYKPVQLGALTALVGGYDEARAIHLLLLVALVGFSAGHVVLVALHPRTMLDMTAGGPPRPIATEDRLHD